MSQIINNFKNQIIASTKKAMTSEIVGLDMEIGQTLGTGGQASVKLGTDRNNNKKYAVKIYDNSKPEIAFKNFVYLVRETQ